MADAQAREKILGAFLTLLAEKRFERIELSEVAQLANVSLADMRGEFGSTFDLVAAFMRETDKKVLSGGEQLKLDPELGDVSARDRLFEVLMRRFEALSPYREAIRSLYQIRAHQSAVGDGAQQTRGALAAMDVVGGRRRFVRHDRRDARTGACRVLRARDANLAQ